VLVIDVETHKIVDVNPLATELIGLPKNEIVGKVCNDFICPAEFGKCPKCDLGQVLDKTECVLLTSNRREIPIFKSVTSTTHQGHEYLIESFVDITSRKKAEQELEKLNADLELANKELIRANKELKEFTNIAAHDLKTPLRAIGVLANWLLKDYAEKFDEQGREQVKLLIGRAERMNKLIDGLLEYANAGQVSNKQKVDLNTVLSKVISEIPSTKNTEIIVKNTLPTIYCDKNFITRVFWHIINNAVRYSDKSQRQIKIGCVLEDGFWKFSIADNGPGIDHKYFEKIFKIGQKLSPHDITGGTGIGLSIAKKIIEDEGGKIWVESVINKGSTFYFTLPYTSDKVSC
jgi:PAS domain S-box-containing protein